MQFTLPDLQGIYPFPPATNPHYDAVVPEARAWAKGFGIPSPKKQSQLSASPPELLAAWAYPYASLEGFRTCCYLTNVIFLLDDFSDDECGSGARAISNSFMNATRDPSQDDGTSFARLAKEFGKRLSTCSPATRQRWIDTFGNYLDATAREAKNREHGTILGLEDYINLRRGNSGLYPMFAVIECILGIDLGPKVDHLVLSNMTRTAVDLAMIANDVYSYNKEQADGHSANNFITVVMVERGVSLQEAFDSAGEYFETKVKEFLDWKAKIPSWGPEIDGAVSQYVFGLECWVGGYLEWSLNSRRYFGDSVEEVRRTRKVVLSKRVQKQNFQVPFFTLLPLLVAISATYCLKYTRQTSVEELIR